MFSLLVAFFAVAIVFSFLCSTWEAVLLSVTPAHAQRLRAEGKPIGRLLQSFKRDIDRPLAAILTLNTIAHTVGAIGVGNQATLLFAEANPLITTLLIPALMTLGILILSEIIPKTLGAVYWRELTPFTVRCLVWVIWVFTPLIWLSEMITSRIKAGGKHGVMTRHDYLALTELGFAQGALDGDESRLIKNMLRFRELKAEDAMTPRTVMLSANSQQTLAAFMADHPDLRFSRVPVHRGEPDRINGFVLKSDVQAALLAGRGEDLLADLQRDILVLLNSTPIATVLEKLLAGGEHIALVVDEYGGVDGLITMEDVIETLLGLDVTDEMDEIVNMRAHARSLWRRRAGELGLKLDDPSQPRQ